MAVTEEPQVSEQPEKKTNSKRSEYAVMVCYDPGQDFETAEEAFEKGSWQWVGNYVVTDNGGQKNARVQAVEDDEDLAKALKGGEQVHFVCLPRRSLHPFTAGYAQKDPELVI